MAARQRGLQLAPPLFIPAGLGLLGGFGSITRIKSFVPDRTSLAAVAAAGPLASSALAAAIMVAGAVLTVQQVGGVELDVASFRWAAAMPRQASQASCALRVACSVGGLLGGPAHALNTPLHPPLHPPATTTTAISATCHTTLPTPACMHHATPRPHNCPPAHLPARPRRESLLAGTMGKAMFGDRLFQSDAVSTNPLFVAGWAGLIINAINMLPAGELDGGRVFHGALQQRGGALRREGASAQLWQLGEAAAGGQRVGSLLALMLLPPAGMDAALPPPLALTHHTPPPTLLSPAPSAVPAAGLCGRRAAARLGSITLLLLGLGGFNNSLALFWLILVVTLQRGPIPPCDNELSPIQEPGTKAAAIAALLLPLLVLLPYPMPLSFTGGLPDLPPTF